MIVSYWSRELVSMVVSYWSTELDFYGSAMLVNRAKFLNLGVI